jgi:hypothetical protein
VLGRRLESRQPLLDHLFCAGRNAWSENVFIPAMIAGHHRALIVICIDLERFWSTSAES